MIPAKPATAIEISAIVSNAEEISVKFLSAA
jgi:hypothetical protein